MVDPITGANVGLPYRPCPPGKPRRQQRLPLRLQPEHPPTSTNGADRISGLGIASFQLTPEIRLFAEVTYAKTKDTFESHPAPDYLPVPIVDPAQIPYAFDTPPSTIYIGGRFMQAGPRITERTSELINTVVGAEGTNYGLDWKANIGRGESKITNKDSNYLAADLFFDAVLAGQIDPTVTTNRPGHGRLPQGLPDSQGQVDGRVPQPAALGRRRRHAGRPAALCRRRAILAREAERRS